MIRLQKYGWLPLVSMIINVLILLLFSNGSLTEAFVVSIRQHRSHSDTRNVNVYGDEWQLNAKKNRKKANSNDDLFDWYQKIDNAQETNPDDIFWEEMERQKLWSNSNGDNSPKEASTNFSALLRSTPFDQDAVPRLKLSALPEWIVKLYPRFFPSILKMQQRSIDGGRTVRILIKYSASGSTSTKVLPSF